jgi:excisionase family DNA binding protein
MVRTVWSVADIRGLGASTDLVTAASVLGIGRTTAYAMARRGVFPVPVCRVGRRYRVPLAPILRLLALDADQPTVAVREAGAAGTVSGANQRT